MMPKAEIDTHALSYEEYEDEINRLCKEGKQPIELIADYIAFVEKLNQRHDQSKNSYNNRSHDENNHGFDLHHFFEMWVAGLSSQNTKRELRANVPQLADIIQGRDYLVRANWIEHAILHLYILKVNKFKLNSSDKFSGFDALLGNINKLVEDSKDNEASCLENFATHKIGLSLEQVKCIWQKLYEASRVAYWKLTHDDKNKPET